MIASLTRPVLLLLLARRLGPPEFHKRMFVPISKCIEIAVLKATR